MSKKSRGLFDDEYQLELINKHQPPFAKLNVIIDWEMFRAPIEEKFAIEPKAPDGRRPFDRLLILLRHYNLSDEQTKFQIKNKMLFIQFLNLEIGDKVPDEKTILLFKEKQLSKKLFELFTQMLVSNGIIAKEGSIVDASFVNVSKQKNSKEENEAIKQGNILESFEENPAKLSQNKRSAHEVMFSEKDCDARWMTKNRVNADAATQMITKFTTSTANIHDSQALEELIDRSDKRLFFDSAYTGKTIESCLNFKNVKSFIHEKKYRNAPLIQSQEKCYTMKSKIRSKVEHVFGFLTNSMNNGLALKAIGKERIASTIALLNLTYNLFRYEQLIRLKKVKVM